MDGLEKNKGIKEAAAESNGSQKSGKKINKASLKFCAVSAQEKVFAAWRTHTEMRNNHTFWVWFLSPSALLANKRINVQAHSWPQPLGSMSHKTFLSLFHPSKPENKNAIMHCQAFYNPKKAPQSPLNSSSQVILPSAAHRCNYPHSLPISSALLLLLPHNEAQMDHLTSFTPVPLKKYW